MGIRASLGVKALLLTASRAANWLVVYFQLLDANVDYIKIYYGEFHIIWLPVASIFTSIGLCYLFLRTEKTRRSGCPALLVALIQVGPLLELSPWPLCPSCSRKKPARGPIALELAQREERPRCPGQLQGVRNTDLEKLRARVLRKMCVAQVPESICCCVLALIFLIQNLRSIHFIAASEAAVQVRFVVMCASGATATILVAWGFADIIISMWVKTDFVQENARLVVFFYLVEICSWWPFLSQIAIEADVLLMVRYLSTELIVMTFLVVCGFYAIPGSSKFRGSILNIVLHFFGQVALAATMSPFLAGANLLFFDNSLTFRYLNRWYYPVRYLHVALYVERLPYSIHQLFLDPVNDIAVVFLSIQIILVYLVVPKLRTASQRDKAEEFQQKTGGALEVSVTNVKGMHGDQSRPRATTGLRSRIFHDAPRAAEGEDSFVEVLNAVGDTFEALLLASQADSPRVRCAVLGVAIQPLSEAGTAKLLLLLPLILPQLLLALRWTTVEDFEDCPLSCFILEKALSLKDTKLVSMVYWQLLGLATDQSDKACLMYREVRLRLLYALLQRDFNGRQYDDEYCNQALDIIADQRRVSFQIRALCRAVQSAKGGHAGRTAALRQQLAVLKDRRDRREAGQASTPETPPSPATTTAELEEVQVESSASAETETGRSSTRASRSRSESLEEMRRKKQVIFVEEVTVREDCEADTAPCARERSISVSSFNMMRQPSQDYSRTDEQQPSSCCSRCRCCFSGKNKKAKVDLIREEWKADPSLQTFGNQELTLMNAGTPLPVDPAQPLGALSCKKCFVANSAVAPVVFAFQDAHGASRLYAMKKGDDLRQDALVLQIFRIMEAAWAEHGLKEVSLLPYNVLALSPKEGMAAFVPRAKNVSSILEEFDGDISNFIKQHCAGAVSAAYDRLCGSTAGYCIATYVLGIGDRHLDNIMITEDGHFFHIDFGFVLGDDPKPGSPSVRVPREVLEVLRASGRYDRFRELLREAFTLIRRTARLWTALLSLASSAGGAGVTPLRYDAERAIHTVRQRLHLELDDASAAAEITAEVELNATAMLPVIYDKLHQAGLFWH
ncbi:unnamed protein product [Effrenium voratum]|uniref:PI3K/PI4K catalytic domain-containing protein n=1 Tax=Effrenium voratum TaxID=2562239 RepID=A0AA36JEJ2_9DINO|nr:unnamed protein product [Effrenium voratum]